MSPFTAYLRAKYPTRPQSRRAIQALSLFTSIWIVLAAGAMGGYAQTYTERVLSDLPGPSRSDLILASDGNFYGTTTTGGASDKGTIFKMTSTGVVTVSHSFSGSDGDTPFSGVIEGWDGNFYGTTTAGGSSSSGTIFKITPTGTLTTLYSFTGGADGGTPLGALVQGSDGSLYGTTSIGGDLSIFNPSGVFFKIGTSGGYAVLTTFTGAQFGMVADKPGTMLQAANGNFYGTSSLGGASEDNGTVFEVSPTGTPTLLWSFSFQADGAHPSFPALLQGLDGSLYGAAPLSNAGSGGGVIYQYGLNGSLAPVHSFDTPSEGSYPVSGLIWGTDGNLYGTADLGGLSKCGAGNAGCGTFYRISLGGNAPFTVIYQFEAVPDASSPLTSTPIQGMDGNFYGLTLGGGSSNKGAAYEISVSPSLPAPVQLIFSGTTPAILNQPIELSWKVHNAFSTTSQQCVASIRDSPVGAGNWSGIQSGAQIGQVYGGSAMITPTKAGTYTYALTCGGKQSGFATLIAGNPLAISGMLPAAQVGVAYSQKLNLTGGTPPYTFSLLSGNMPPGLSLDTATGLISGKPTQFGTYNPLVQVRDSTAPVEQASATVNLIAKSGLTITTMAFVTGSVGTDFRQVLTGTGGMKPYSWSVTAGTLPDGIALDAATGKLTGNPTKMEKQKITLQLADSELKPAMITVTLTFEIQLSQSIAAVEFTQAIQQYQTLSDLKTTLFNNSEPPVPIIAGKPAVMRVYFSPVTDATPISLIVSGPELESTQFRSLLPNCQPKDQRGGIGACSSADFYFVPPTGEWTINLELDNSMGKKLESESLTMSSRKTKSIQLSGVTACDTNPYHGAKVCGDASTVLRNYAYLNSIMPTVTVTPILSGLEVDENSGVFTSATQEHFWLQYTERQVNSLYSPADALNDMAENQRTTYMGIYKPQFFESSMAEFNSHGALVSSPSRPFTMDDIVQTMAHETGHTLGLRHTNVSSNRTTAPPGCFGMASDLNAYWPYPDNYVQSSQGMEYGFDVTARALKNPNSTFDIMSYCTPRWISPIQYKMAIAALGGGDVSSPSVIGSRREFLPAVPSPKQASAPIAGNYIQVQGVIGSTNVTFDPIFTETLNGSTDPGSGAYSIVLKGGSGQVLYTRYFDPISSEIDLLDGTEGTTGDGDLSFSEWIPQTAGMESIAVLDPTGALLSTIAVKGTAPVVKITAPAAGFVGTFQQTVSWTIDEPGVTNFTSRIFYSPDNGVTWTQASVSADTSAVLDFTQLSGSTTALIRVDVSDGVNTGTATSPFFTVDRKKPSTIVINTPNDGAILQAASPVFLTGAAYDADDGMLTGSHLAWSSDIQGKLGTGSPLQVRLEAGTHTITLTATDSDGNAIKATSKIIMAGAAPTVTLTTARVSTNCIGANIAAAPGAEGADLSLVEYSLDGGVTYTQVASGQLPYAFTVPGSGDINLVAVAQDASGQTDAQSTRLTLAVACGPSTLKALSGSTQSATIDTAFGMPLKAVVLDSAGNALKGVTITLSAPASGASAVLSADSAVTDATGAVSVTAVANAVTGNFNVTASATGISSVATFALTNNAAVAPDFAIAAASNSLTIANGASASDAISVTTTGGFDSKVTFTCSGLPSGATCSFSPAAVTPPTSSSTMVTVTLSQTSAHNELHPEGASKGALACCLFGASLWLLRRRRKAVFPMLCLSTLSLSLFSGCGSSGHSKPAPTSFTVAVTATSGTLQRALQIKVN